MDERPRHWLSKLVLYGITAGVAMVVDVGGFAMLVRLDVFVVVAAASSFCVSAVVNYLLSSRFTFRQQASMRRFLVFFAFASLGMVLNVGITSAGVLVFGLAPLIAKIVGVGVAFLANFVLNLKFVFVHDGTTASR